MKPKSLLPFFIVLISLASCDRIIDNYYEQQAQENHTSPYMGKWVGNYTGNEAGTLIITVSKGGEIMGNYGQNNEGLASYVYDDGTLQPVISNSYTLILYGNLKDKKGTWKNKDKQGTWTLTKQLTLRH